ncbi:MAG: ornithine carbamoyltransferase [Proteobacteria bacterium]|nr:ornithine carbamoyltransferase [Desulfobacteraceae bacterium]MBU3980639.1 ornithine carbamoyltransferase [Pseudomonadota bacterium]MBU4013326.1 ornithine carbamoyltransferase [Pseudomonadota bacterium]MBU4066811.1 ornithine carbamoyltransferase [Pseudomonadota bacterium]MBU4101397.1 ornithine carbamoyltransferase [Pseudomonadota bacterium]
MNKDILTLLDLEKEDFELFFKRALELKKNKKKGIEERSLAGKTLGLIFDKPSTRTRLSFEVAMIQLGGASIFISAKDTQMVRNEPVRDTARVLSRYLDGLAIRTYSQDLLKEFAEFSAIPVINALTDLYHPCQVLSDLMTVIEHKGGYEGLKITWVGDGNNVSHSWINAAAVLGLNLVLACPEGYYPDTDILEKARERSHGSIIVTSDPVEAAKNADVIYTDVWASMGQESEQKARARVFEPFHVDKELLENSSQDVIIMHCLPVHRGEEISEEVLEGPHSVVWDQSENKLHMHKAILEVLIK